MHISSETVHDRLRVIALTIGLVSAGSGLLSLANSLVLSILVDHKWAYVPATDYAPSLATSLVVLGLIIFAWRKPFIGMALIAVWLIRTILSVVTSLDSIPVIFRQGFWNAWLLGMIFSLLLLVSGILFLLSMRSAPAIADKVATQSMTRSRRCKRLQFSGLIVGLVGGIMNMQRAGPLELVSNLVFLGAGLVIFGGVALAWKRPLLGGIVLIIESLWPLALFVASPLFPASDLRQLAYILWPLLPVTAPFLFIPVLTSGILFILSWA